MEMIIEQCLSNTIDLENGKIKYSYRMTKSMLYNEDVFGIEVERQDIKNGQVVNIERDSINVVSKQKEKASKLLNLLFENNVSPIHLIDIVSPYAEDNYVDEFTN